MCCYDEFIHSDLMHYGTVVLQVHVLVSVSVTISLFKTFFDPSYTLICLIYIPNEINSSII